MCKECSIEEGDDIREGINVLGIKPFDTQATESRFSYVLSYSVLNTNMAKRLSDDGITLGCRNNKQCS